MSPPISDLDLPDIDGPLEDPNVKQIQTDITSKPCECGKPLVQDADEQCNIKVPDISMKDLENDDAKTRFYTGVVINICQRLACS